MNIFRDLLKEGHPVGLFQGERDPFLGLVFIAVEDLEVEERKVKLNTDMFVRIYAREARNYPIRKLLDYCKEGNSVRIGFKGGSKIFKGIENEVYVTVNNVDIPVAIN